MSSKLLANIANLIWHICPENGADSGTAPETVNTALMIASATCQLGSA